MHVDLQAAKQQAESWRKNGSVFYINEIPAIVMQSENLTLVVTQINCDVVFADYRPNGVHHFLKNPVSLRNHMLPGASLRLAVSSLARDSGYWKIQPPPRDSVLLFKADIPLQWFDAYRESSVNQYRSESVGGQCALIWKEYPSIVKSKAIRNIVRLRNRSSTMLRELEEKTG